MTQLYIGLLSGTSVDAIDAALVDFSQTPPKLLGAINTPINPQIKELLLEWAHADQLPIADLLGVDKWLGHAFAQSACALLKHAGYTAGDIKAIGSHGQTIIHLPDEELANTLQIGCGHTIACETAIRTIADFRRKDMALGGQGAPLVPGMHFDFFHKPGTCRAIVNIGGFANITVLDGKNVANTIGFDTGPGNALMDLWCQKHNSAPYDVDGTFARSGNICHPLLEHMLKDDYFLQSGPKSTGRDAFNLEWLDLQIKETGGTIDEEDVQTTLAELTAQTIADAVKLHQIDPAEVYVCGGGYKNTYLMERLAAQLNSDKVQSTNALGVDPDWVEAITFAWLAYRYDNNLPGNIPQVTGASRPAVLGAVYLP